MLLEHAAGRVENTGSEVSRLEKDRGPCRADERQPHFARRVRDQPLNDRAGDGVDHVLVSHYLEPSGFRCRTAGQMNAFQPWGIRTVVVGRSVSAGPSISDTPSLAVVKVNTPASAHPSPVSIRRELVRLTPIGSEEAWAVGSRRSFPMIDTRRSTISTTAPSTLNPYALR